jgi:hypothetical protein
LRIRLHDSLQGLVEDARPILGGPAKAFSNGGGVRLKKVPTGSQVPKKAWRLLAQDGFLELERSSVGAEHEKGKSK